MPRFPNETLDRAGHALYDKIVREDRNIDSVWENELASTKRGWIVEAEVMLNRIFPEVREEPTDIDSIIEEIPNYINPTLEFNGNWNSITNAFTTTNVND